MPSTILTFEERVERLSNAVADALMRKHAVTVMSENMKSQLQKERHPVRYDFCFAAEGARISRNDNALREHFRPSDSHAEPDANKE